MKWNRDLPSYRVVSGIIFSLIVMLTVPGGLDTASAQQSCTGDPVCESIQQFNIKLKDIRKSTQTMSTLKSALEGTVSFSVCPNWALSAGLGLGVGFDLSTKGEGGAGGYVLGNGIAGHLKGKTHMAAGGSLGGNLGISAFPCINVDALHTVVSGDSVIPVIPTYDIDDGLDPGEECPECGSESISWEMDAGLQDDVSRIIADISPVDILNTVIELIIDAGSELESGIGIMDEESIRDIVVALLSGQAIEATFDEVSEFSQQGGAGIADTALSAFGRLRNMVDASPAGDWMRDLVHAIDTISSPNSQQSILESVASPCGTFLSTSWCDDAKEVADKIHGVIKQITTPGWVDKFHEIGNLSLGVKNKVNKIWADADSVLYAAQNVKQYAGSLTSKADDLISVQSTVISKIDEIYQAVGVGLNTVKSTVCIERDFDIDVDVCSAWIDIRICEANPIQAGGSCPWNMY